MADNSVLGSGSNQNRPSLHVSGKRSNLHLSFQNENKTPEPPISKVVEIKKAPPTSKIGNDTITSCYDIEQSSMPPTLTKHKSISQSAPVSHQSSQQYVINSFEAETSLSPPPLPPKLKLKPVGNESFHQVTMGTGYSKPKFPIPYKDDFCSKKEIQKSSVNANGETLKHRLDTLNLNLSPIGSPSSRWGNSTSNNFLMNSSKLSAYKESQHLQNKISNEDIDSILNDPSAREQKKKQLILHLPPSGASHQGHHQHLHHLHHRHVHHDGRSHRRERLSRGYCHNIQLSGKLNISPEVQVDFIAEDLKDLGEIGRGGFGTVNKMVHRKTNTIMAVKRIRLTVDENEQKQLRDLEVAMWSNDCPFIVQFYGATLKEGDCWICMELMDTSLDKFYKYVYEKLNDCIPESILGKVTVATLTALNYLKEKLKLIHRDVKPSNILLDKRGNIKLCDFGISGHLVDSIAKTRDAGCRPYMAPERIDPAQARGYDVRSDVWSLGITLMELATGSFPYPKWNSVFEQLTQVVQGEPPRLNLTENGNIFTEEFVNFVNTCLTKEESARPKYKQLMDHSFVIRSNQDTVNVAQYVCGILDQMENNGKFMYTYNSYNY